MIRRLYVRNYALLQEAELLPKPGLNLLTGETGAGKSLLVGAIGLVLGNRADPGVLLDPDQKCIVEAAFAVANPGAIRLWLEENDLELEDGELIVRRVILPSGKSRAFVNDLPVTLEALRELTGGLVSLHGQHEGQDLVDPRRQLALLDAYAGCTAQAATFGDTLRRFREVNGALTELRAQAAEAERQYAYHRHQADELAAAQLSAEEEAALEELANRVRHAEEIQTTLLALHAQLETQDAAVLEQLSAIERELAHLAGLDKSLENVLEAYRQVRYGLADIAEELRSRAEAVELDPAEAQRVTERQDVYNTLKHKFRVQSATELLALQAEFDAKAQQFGSVDERITALADESTRLEKTLIETGLALEAARQTGAKVLEQAVQRQLAAVALPQARFRIHLERLQRPGGEIAVNGEAVAPVATGINSIRFELSTNPGLPPGPLSKIASGGEVSRVMLALKAALAERLALATLIFDEIDTGISGEVALQVGSVMEHLAEKHQLLAITHLPQIASRAGAHFEIYKAPVDGKTRSVLRELSSEERTQAVAQLLSGAQPGAAALQTARDLLNAKRPGVPGV